MKKITIATLTILFSSSTYATSFFLPQNCEYGRVKSYDMQDAQELGNAVEAGYDIYQDPNFNQNNYSAWIELIKGIKKIINSVDYLRIEVPTHVLQGEEFRAKANLFDRYANILFNNSEYGYIGTDKSNLDANAYHYMKFSRTYGVGLIWVNRASGMCSAEAVWVQKAPKVSQGSVRSTNGGQISADVEYIIDKYSRAAKDSSVPVQIILKARSDFWNKTDSKTVTINGNRLTGQHSFLFFPSMGGGPYDISATVYDGTYSHTIKLGSVHVPGAVIAPCKNCNIL